MSEEMQKLRDEWFTWDVVDLLRRAVVPEEFGFCDEPPSVDDEATNAVRSLANRIAALLPPRP